MQYISVHAYIYEDHIAQRGISQGMLHAQLIPLQSQIDPQHRRALNGQAFHSSARAKSWGPDRRVPFATMAGDAAPPNLVNEANLFPSNHPGIDFYVAVEPGATPPAVLKAFRHKGWGLHPDKATDPVEKKRRSEEFTMLSTARGILANPLLAVQYRYWRV